MKGDFSRFSFNPGRHYDRVLQQQGRVQTDADWNEQGDIAAYRHSSALRDVIGHFGVPRDKPGFGIRGHGGLRFDGQKSYLEIKAALPLRLEDYTVECWVKIEGERRNATLVSRIDRDWTKELAGGFRLGVTSQGRLRFERIVLRDERYEEIDIDVDAWGDVIEEDIVVDAEVRRRVRVVGRQQLPIGRFFHVAAVCRGGAMRLFVDGVLDAEKETGNGAPFESVPVFIGCDHVRHRPASYFAGVIDQLRIWRKGLDASRLRAAMFGDVGRSEHDLAYHWHLEDARSHGGHGAHMPVAAQPELWIGVGHCYIDGVRSENDADIHYEQQPDCPGLVLPDIIRPHGRYLAYIDSWERVVTGLEDGSILEPALGGPDTSLRLRTVSQVRLLPLAEHAAATLPPELPHGALQMSASLGRPSQDNLLLRVEIHDAGVAVGGPIPQQGEPDTGLEVTHIDAASSKVTVVQPYGRNTVWRLHQPVELVRPGSEIAVSAHIVAVGEETAHGYRTLQLSTVPRDAGDPTVWRLRAIATFKWSRDNGAWTFAVVAIDAKSDTGQMSLKLADPNRTRQEIHPGDWIELSDDDTVLLNLAGPLGRIGSVGEGDANGFTVALEQPTSDPLQRQPDQRIGRHALLRRWDGIDDGTPSALGVKPVVAGKTLQLDAGVQIAFAAGHYERGDFWTAPLRDRLQWPKDENGAPLALPPQGVQHRRAALALIRFGHHTVEVKDLRPVFPPLADAAANARPHTMANPRRVSHGGSSLRAREKEGIEDERVMIDFGLVPPDHCILGPTEEPPIGWHFTGIRWQRAQPDPKWRLLDLRMPQAGAAAAVALQQRLFVVTAGGELLAVDPRRPEPWAACRPLPGLDFAGLSTVVVRDKLHVLSGFNADGDATGRHSQYDPVADAWRDLAPLPVPRGRVAAAALGDNLMVIGGSRTRHPRPTDEVHCYVTSEDRWDVRQSLPHGLYAGAAGEYHGRIYLFGGSAERLFHPGGELTPSAMMFSPRAERWTELPPLAKARRGALVVRAENQLYVVGGNSSDDEFAPIELFDPRDGDWVETALPQPMRWRGDGGVAMLDGTLYLLGGVAPDGATDSVEACTLEHAFYVHRKLLPDGGV